MEVFITKILMGILGDIRRFIKAEMKKENSIRSIDEITVDFKDLTKVINDMKAKGYIKDVIIWTSQLVKGFKNLPEAREVDLLFPIK